MTATIFVSIILAIAVVLFSAIAMEGLEVNGRFREEDDKGKRKFVGFGKVTGDGWNMALGLGVLTGVINFFSQFCMHKGLPILSLLMSFVMLAAMFAVMVYWLKEGSEWRELWPFLVLSLLLFVVAKQAALAGAVFTANSQFWSSVVKILPLLTLIAVAGIMVAGTAKYRAEERKDLPENARERNNAWFKVAVVLTILALLLTLGLGIAWGAIGNFTKPAGEAGRDFPHYYNLDVQNDGLDNDYNFGPNPWAENYTAEQADAEFRARLKRDPMLGAADISWLDAKVGTQYLGDYYAQAENNWARAINSATESFAQDKTKYYETLDPFFAFLDSAIQVEVRDCQAVEDQMYANPHTASGIPEVVVFKTTDHSGHELVYTFSIKGNVFEVAYRIECGFQPTNVEKVMHIPAQDKSTGSTPSTTPTPDNPDVNPGSDPTPTPTPDDNQKDPSKLTGEDTEPDDNKGPGENTIDPSDPNHSSKDTGDGSNSYNMYEEYVQEIEDKQSINDTQKVGGDANVPNITPAPSTNVDNNGNAGTGNGGIDTATPTQNHAETSNGGSISNTESNPAGAWGDDEDPK